MPTGPRKLGGDLSLLKGLTPAQVWLQFFPTCIALLIISSSRCTCDILHRRDCCSKWPTKHALHTSCAPTRAAISNGLLHICGMSCLFLNLCTQLVGSWFIVRSLIRRAPRLLLRPVFFSVYISWPRGQLSLLWLCGFVHYNYCTKQLNLWEQ